MDVQKNVCEEFMTGFDSDIINTAWMPSYLPALYRYFICMALSGNTEQIEGIIRELQAARNFQGSPVSRIEVCAETEQMLNNIYELFNGADEGGVKPGRKKHELLCASDRDGFGLLVPLAAALGKNCIFRISESLMDQSMFAVLKTLKVHGIRHELISRNSMRIWGRLTTGTFIIPSDLDPSFLSGLLMALPLLQEKSILMVDGPFIPELHVNLTLKSMERAGIKTEFSINTDNRENVGGAFIGASFKIMGGQTYKLNTDLPAGNSWPYDEAGI